MARKKLTAKTADRHQLYQWSVQSPEADIEFIEKVYRREYDKKPLSLREDFCGTALICSEWVKKKKRTAIGVDLDKKTLKWGRKHNIEPLGEKASRVTLINANVLDVSEPKVDVAIAFNFSYFVFKQRRELKRYFETARRSIKDDGMFILDLLGGPEAQTEIEETYPQEEGFDYIWDQDNYNPINADYRCYIHFKFRDGSKMKRAFTYEWRLWTLMELRDLLEEVGFSRTDVYWEGTDDDGEGNGVFRRQNKAENDEAWVSYVVAVP